jgi:hypothetical protein
LAKRVGLRPAYGRDYKSKAEVVAALQAGKDFVGTDFGSPFDGRYVNLPQLRAEGVTDLTVRIKADRVQVAIVVAKL